MDLNLDNLRNSAIGTVEYVSPESIKVLLETDAPQNTAINTGVPGLFPRISGYVLIPNEIGALVGVIAWIGIEQSQYPKRKGFKDFDLIDLPFPLRKMSITPVGTLKRIGTGSEGRFELERGVYSFPSVGDSVVIPTETQLRAIVENRSVNADVVIGRAPLAGNAEIYVDPDKLFSRHLAILGNTGSGKSCSVAGLIRWSLDAARKRATENEKPVNARFIILDPNGEYSNAFSDNEEAVRKFVVSIGQDQQHGVDQLRIPAWMWNSSEWISFSQAAPGAQRPLLLDALRGLKSGRQLEDPARVRLRRLLNGHLFLFQEWLAQPPAKMNWGDRMNCGRSLNILAGDAQAYLDQVTGDDVVNAINALVTGCNHLHNERQFSWNNTTAFNQFAETDLNGIVGLIEAALNVLPPEQDEAGTITADTPIRFDVKTLPDFVEQLAANEAGRDLGQFASLLTLRLRLLLSDERLREVVNPTSQIELHEWLKEYIGEDDARNGQLAIIDLSLVPSDIVHVIIAVFARMVFEALQRYRRQNLNELPTVLVLEEAHSFVNQFSREGTAYSQICLQTFERIAREGRKFGLSLVLSSQRPSELSPTVLSQCNTFLLHRIVNDVDQQLVRRLVPDNVGTLLKELPTLPTRKAILLGWATPIPILVEIRDLPEFQRPHSEDAHFWDVWTGKEERKIDWKAIADEWQCRALESDQGEESETET